MYKVFVRQGELQLISSKKSSSADQADIRCVDSLPSWKELRPRFEDDRATTLTVACDSPKKAWRNFKRRFGMLPAAGGLVLNDKGEVLMIKRLGHWDLPKGKLEKGEDLVDCAIREVEEECGVFGLGITGKINVTYHVMRRGKGKYLKVSHWYMMRTQQVSPGTPQEEEGIEKVAWVPLKDVKKKLKKSWPSIKAVLEASSLEY